MSKEEIKNKEKQLLELTGSFCSQKLDEEYFYLCEKLVKKLGRKREVPFKRGQIEIWAAAVVYAIGSINFLFDKNFEPYVSAQEISDFFGSKNSTVSAKAKKIKELLNLSIFDSEFSTKYISGSNPLNKLVMVDGIFVPLTDIPEDLQEFVKNERAEGRDVSFTTQSE